MVLRDPIRNKVSLLSEERAKRPHEKKDRNFVCPFCPGNEHLTPPEIKRVGDERWEIRVVPNKYPFSKIHEVIIESYEHDSDFDRYTLEHTVEIVKVWKDRLMEHRNEIYTVLFRNFGVLAGASIMHPHSQLVSLDFIPEIPYNESRSLSRKDCALCRYREFFVPVYEDDIVVAIPKTQYYPMEVWIFPREHIRRFEDSPMDRDIARYLIKVIASLKNELNMSDYNLILHSSPKDTDYHWHIEILPRKGQFAGFELATGVNVIHYDSLCIRNSLRK